jgi:hypothetical protein
MIKKAESGSRGANEATRPTILTVRGWADEEMAMVSPTLAPVAASRRSPATAGRTPSPAGVVASR